MKNESGVLSANAIVSELTRSAHGDLEQYVPIGQRALEQDREFYAHLVAWNAANGAVRDAKCALPVIALRDTEALPFEYTENALAALALLDPRNFDRALVFARKAGARHGEARRRLVMRYLRAREDNWSWFERTALQHRKSLRALYARFHIKPNAMADEILFKGKAPAGTVFEALRALKIMEATQAAGTIIEKRIPYLVAVSALGSRAKDPAVALALIERMSPTELVTNTKLLERLGVKDNPALRSAYEAGLARAAKSKKQVLKATRAAEAMTDDTLKEKLLGLQERQLQNLGGVDGNWLVLGDKSGSMQAAIETARHVAATLARMVKGKVHLIFFDTTARYIDATGKEYDELLKLTKSVSAGGGTSIGVGLEYCLTMGYELDGIAVVSDGGENTVPYFAGQLGHYARKFDKQPTVYFYRTVGDNDAFTGFMNAAGFAMETFDLRGMGVDYHSLPNLVGAMRTNRHSMRDEIMATPLLTLDGVFGASAGA